MNDRFTLKDMITDHPGRDPSFTNTMTVEPYSNGKAVEFAIEDKIGIPNTLSLDRDSVKKLRDYLADWLES